MKYKVGDLILRSDKVAPVLGFITSIFIDKGEAIFSVDWLEENVPSYLVKIHIDHINTFRFYFENIFPDQEKIATWSIK